MRRLTLRPRSLVLAFCGLAGLVSCGHGNSAKRSDASEPRAERLAQTLAGLEQSTARIRAWGGDGELLTRTERLLAELGDEPFATFGDYVFSRRELDFLTQWHKPSIDPALRWAVLEDRAVDHPLRIIAAYASAFRSHGIDFLVVPIPRRLQVYPERLPGGSALPADFPGALEPLEHFLAALVKREVEIVDLLPIFAAARHSENESDDPLLYHGKNPHWTPRAARLAANAIAQAVRALGVLAPSAKLDGASARREQVAYKLPPLFPGAEEPVPVWIDRVVDAQGQALEWRDRSSPCLVLGDSNTHWYGGELSADLCAQLALRLSTTLDAIVLNDGGSESVWMNLARRNDALAGKKVVIWILDANVLLDARLQYVELFSP